MICAICICRVAPSARLNTGRNESIEPKRTIPIVAAMNMITDRRAARWFSTPFALYLSPVNSPFAMRRRYSGSSASSFPTCSEQNAPVRTPANVQGTEIIRMSINDICCPDSILSNATVAAEIGLAVIACWEAITAIPNGRSGRIFVSVATSTITGRTE